MQNCIIHCFVSYLLRCISTVQPQRFVTHTLRGRGLGRLCRNMPLKSSPLSLFTASYRQLPLVTADCRYMPPIAAGFRYKPPIAAHCRCFPLQAANCRSLPQFYAACRCLQLCALPLDSARKWPFRAAILWGKKYAKLCSHLLFVPSHILVHLYQPSFHTSCRYVCPIIGDFYMPYTLSRKKKGNWDEQN